MIGAAAGNVIQAGACLPIWPFRNMSDQRSFPFRISQLGVNEVQTLLWETGQSKINDRIKYFNRSCFDRYADEYTFFLALLEEKVIGAAMLAPSAEHADPAWVCSRFVSVDPEYQSLGVGTALKEAMFSYCAEHGLKLVASSYSQQGAERLKALNYRLAQKFNVEFEDSDLREERRFRELYGREPSEEEKTRSHIRY